MKVKVITVFCTSQPQVGMCFSFHQSNHEPIEQTSRCISKTKWYKQSTSTGLIISQFHIVCFKWYQTKWFAVYSNWCIQMDSALPDVLQWDYPVWSIWINVKLLAADEIPNCSVHAPNNSRLPESSWPTSDMHTPKNLWKHMERYNIQSCLFTLYMNLFMCVYVCHSKLYVKTCF